MPRCSIASAPIQALHRQVLATFDGQLRWFNTAGWIAAVVLFGVASVSAWRFAQAQDLGDALRWGALSALSFAGIALIKVWFWLEIQKNAIVSKTTRGTSGKPCCAASSSVTEDRPPAGIR